MALMSAGVPLKKPVAGIAMGLIKEEDSYAILSDILGDEDFLGDMDFKVAGTSDGITACQMDIKIEGLSIEQMTIALNQAKQGRLHILGKMAETISEVSTEMSPYAPRLYSMKVKEDEIGMVIGPGGSNIREIVAQSGAQINIEEDGTVIIAATTQESADIAIAMIQKTVQKPEAGIVYNGTVKEVREGLGALIEILPKQVGLLHISQIAWEKTENVGDHFKKGDKVEVLLEEIGRDGKYRLSRRALLPKPEGYVERPPRPPRENDDRRRDDRRGGGRDDRRGGGRDDRRDNRDSGNRENRD
jgi:polyribonucleotide nucleotidyltransferase